MFKKKTFQAASTADAANAMRTLPNRTELLVDDEDKGQEESGTSVPDTGGLLFLGRNQFQGCVSNLYTRR